MQLGSSNFRRGSSRRNRQTSTRSPGSTVINGSTASDFLSLIRLPNFCSRTPTISAKVIVFFSPLAPRPSRLGRCGPFLVLDGERVGLRVVVELGRQLHIAGARRDRYLDGLLFRQVAHALDLVLNPHEPFEKCFRARRAARYIYINRDNQIDPLDHIVTVLVVRAAAAGAGA